MNRKRFASLCMVFVLASCADPDERASVFIDEGESADTRQVDAEDIDIDVKRNSDFFSNKDNDLDSSQTGGNTPSPIIPSPRGSCPVLKTGTVNVMGNQVMLWVGQRRDDVKGMVYFYWHSTGAGPDEAKRVLGPAIDEIVASGGVVASFTGRPPNMPILQGNTGNGVWYVQDFKIADEVLACAVQQLNIDKRRIYAGGTSAGGLQTGVMAINRSNYLAAAMTNSGGILEPLVQTGTCPLKWAHPEWVPAMISVHGGIEDWWLGMEFGEATRDMNNRLHNRGGFVVNCNHGGGHCQASRELLQAQWQFQRTHRFGESRSPFANGLPRQFPRCCRLFD